jgi:hypothetical protein
VAGLAASAA